MISRCLQLEDLQDIKDPLSVAVLFEQLGYAACCDTIDVEDLELPPASADSIRNVYLLANQGNADLQIFLFELHPHCWSSDAAAANRMYSIAKNLCQRPSFFLLVATYNYKQLLLVSPIKTFNERMELGVKMSKAFIDLKNPSFYTLTLLEKMTTRSLDLRSLYQVQHQTLANARSIEKPGLDNDSVGWYLKQIGRIPLLTSDEEVCFSRKIQHYLDLEKSKRKLKSQLKREVTDQEWADLVSLRVSELYDALLAGKCALNRLVTANLRLVVSIAKRYQNRGIDFLDLIQDGNEGLIKAAKNFDVNKGCRFSTYATWWIRQSITKSIDNFSRIIRLPIYLSQKICRIKKSTQVLTQELRRKPTILEIATAVGATIEQVYNYNHFSTSIFSLDANLTEHLTLADSLADSHTLDEWLEQQSLEDEVDQMLSKLTLKQQEIIRLRFGFLDNKEHTLQEIGDYLGVTRERIRQIESKALKKIRGIYSSLHNEKSPKITLKEILGKNDVIDLSLPVKNPNTKDYAIIKPKKLKVIKISNPSKVESNNHIDISKLIKIPSDKRNTKYKIIPDDHEALKEYIDKLVSTSSYTTLEQIIYIALKISKHSTPDLYAIAETELLQLMGWQLPTSSINHSIQSI